MRVSVLTSAVGKHQKSSISRKELDSFDNIIKDFCTICILYVCDGELVLFKLNWKTQ